MSIKIDDKNLYNKINAKYDKYKIKKEKKTYNQWCYPKSYTLQNPQIFLSKFINPSTEFRNLFVYHRIGSGKTCTAIQIAENFKKKKKIIIVVPASLKGNFRSELRSQCGGNEYLTEKEREKMEKFKPSDKEYQEIINASDERIDKYYEIYSYDIFIDMLKSKTLKLNNTLLIIDEVQNLVSENGSRYHILYNALKNKSIRDLRTVLLSATPMFDKPSEIALTLNLLNVRKELPTGIDFNNEFIKTIESKSSKAIKYDIKNVDELKDYIRGYISYYSGAPEYVFPKTKIKYEICEMHKFQEDVYNKIYESEKFMDGKKITNDFYLGTRMVSNIVFPNGSLNKKGFDMITPALVKKNLEKYSCKYAKICERLKRGGKTFVYSNFKSYAGIESFVKVLECMGYMNYAEYGPGKNRFCVFSGDESEKQKNEYRSVFNQKDNVDGSLIKIFIGSPSIKEGVSLLNVRNAHIIDVKWNMNSLYQIIGRVSRYCSHKQLDEDKRSVNVYVYLAKTRNGDSVDKMIRDMADKKQELIDKFEKVIIESSIDCELNKNSTELNGEKIKCDK